MIHLSNKVKMMMFLKKSKKVYQLISLNKNKICKIKMNIFTKITTKNNKIVFKLVILKAIL